MKKFIIFLEIVVFICSLTICFFWYKSPNNNNFSIYLAITGTLTIGFEILRRNINPKEQLKYSSLIFDNGDLIFVNYTDEKYSEKGKLALIFYSMKITNNSDISFKIKNLHLEYNIYDTILNADLQFIPCDYQSSPLYENNISQVKIFIKQHKSYIILQGWKNFSSTESKYVRKGDIIDFSLCFQFNLNYDDADKLKNVKLVINDYSGNEIKHPIKIEQKWIDDGKFAFINYYDNLPKKYKLENNINPFKD